ncbi:MAG: hypothetical protein KBD46_02795 [Candidatus Levybacteria bacterium]|nr:hypothetical protein [Candidatus Levybacteria bacterium]
MKRIEKVVLEENCHKIYLETGQGWKAEKFYTALGFEKTAALKNHYHKKDFVIYTKYLNKIPAKPEE